MTREAVNHWCERLVETVGDDAAKPLRAADERIIRLYESLEALIGQAAIDRHYQLYGGGDNSTESVGIAYLKDAYEMRGYVAAVKAEVKASGRGWAERSETSEQDNEPEIDHRLILAREVWRRGSVRKMVADAARLVVAEFEPALHHPLSENDRSILTAMLEIDAAIHNPQSAATIVKTALYSGDQKRAFENLMLNGLVKSKEGRAGGYWLTDTGIELAKRLSANGATV